MLKDPFNSDPFKVMVQPTADVDDLKRAIVQNYPSLSGMVRAKLNIWKVRRLI